MDNYKDFFFENSKRCKTLTQNYFRRLLQRRNFSEPFYNLYRIIRSLSVIYYWINKTRALSNRKRVKSARTACRWFKKTCWRTSRTARRILLAKFSILLIKLPLSARTLSLRLSLLLSWLPSIFKVFWTGSLLCQNNERSTSSFAQVRAPQSRILCARYNNITCIEKKFHQRNNEKRSNK